MLEDFFNEQERKRKALQRGHILVWYILLPIAIACVAYRLWQYFTGRL